MIEKIIVTSFQNLYKKSCKGKIIINNSMYNQRTIQVFLNVYDLIEYNHYVHSMGVGAYHSGVEILGKGTKK